MSPSRVWAASVLAASMLSTTLAIELPEYRGLKVVQNASVLEVTLSNPDSAINLWGEDFQVGLTDMVQRLQADNETKVVVFKSDVPRFFCAHVDLFIPDIQTIGDRFSALMFNISNLPQVTIGAVEGRARGAGNELLMNLDMRFATRRDTLLGQIELGIGLVTGGGGAQLLAQILGRGRAMEYILSGKDINAEDAEKLGWINKAFDNSDDMYAHIADLTERFSLFPRGALIAGKNEINSFARPPQQNYLNDAAAFNARLTDPVVPSLMAAATALTNNFTLGEVELNLGASLPLVYN